LTANTAADNTGIGKAALLANTTGTRNVAVGKHALLTNTTAQSNTAVGYTALNDTTTGSGNTGIGSEALFKNTTAANNTGIGHLAMYENTTGHSNTAIGMSALKVNTTGVENVAVGYGALDANQAGGENVAIGYNALGVNTASSNTAVGSASMPACTGGFDNTAVGVSAGISVTTGDNNLFLGHDAGRSGSPGGLINTANNQIVLGDENIANAHIQVDWTVASDQRDKTDFTDLDVGLDFVNGLKPVTYKWDKRSKYLSDTDRGTVDLNTITHDGTHKEDWLDIGFKAQEVEALEKASGYKISDKTNLTTTLSGDGKQYGIKYNKFIPILVKAVQELSTKNDSLETSNTALIARIEALENA